MIKLPHSRQNIYASSFTLSICPSLNPAMRKMTFMGILHDSGRRWPSISRVAPLLLFLLPFLLRLLPLLHFRMSFSLQRNLLMRDWMLEGVQNSC